MLRLTDPDIQELIDIQNQEALLEQRKQATLKRLDKRLTPAVKTESRHVNAHNLYLADVKISGDEVRAYFYLASLGRPQYEVTRVYHARDLSRMP